MTALPAPSPDAIRLREFIAQLSECRTTDERDELLDVIMEEAKEILIARRGLCVTGCWRWTGSTGASSGHIPPSPALLIRYLRFPRRQCPDELTRVSGLKAIRQSCLIVELLSS
jgi:hypothetical protein